MISLLRSSCAAPESCPPETDLYLSAIFRSVSPIPLIMLKHSMASRQKSATSSGAACLPEKIAADRRTPRSPRSAQRHRATSAVGRGFRLGTELPDQAEGNYREIPNRRAICIPAVVSPGMLRAAGAEGRMPVARGHARSDCRQPRDACGGRSRCVTSLGKHLGILVQRRQQLGEDGRGRGSKGEPGLSAPSN